MWTTTSELYWFKAEKIKEKTEMYPETIIGDVFRTQWNIKVEAFCKNRYLYLTVDYFCKTLQVTCFTGLWICLYKTKQDYNLCKFILKLYFIFTLLLCCETNHKLKTRVFHFKLVHPSSWIHVVIISHYLPVQTHHSKEIERKLDSIGLLT